MKSLQGLLSRLSQIRYIGDPSIPIARVQADSRQVQAGDVFVAVRGTNSDGHQYIATAVEQGATAVICETLPTHCKAQVCYAVVPDSSEAWGMATAAWYDYPSEQLQLVGVTGTNGKTTIATLLYRLFRQAGYRAGLLSTICNYVDEESVPSTHTTPDPTEAQALLRRMVDAGCRYAFMEVSSHATQQKRIAGMRFAGGIFTNLTRDHLDYHHDMESYLNAKKLFFDGLPATAFALSNADERNGKVMLQNTAAHPYYYALRTEADYKVKILEAGFEGMLMEFNGTEAFMQFVGEFNASNLAAVYGSACLLGLPSEQVLVLLSTLRPVSGRFDTLHAPQGFTVIVDYAHTPDALKNVLGAIRQIRKLSHSKGRIITLVGCGGNRDKGKRPLMAQEVFRYSDQVILTSDNPRFEDPNAILDDMLAGLSTEQQRQVLVLENRREAIKTACRLAQIGDVILIAGKGHEDYQDIQGIKHPFSDKEIAQEIVNNI